jgi:hypothetical protein
VVVPRRHPPAAGRPRRRRPLLPPGARPVPGVRRPEASTLAHLGAGHHLAGDPAAAREHWRAAHALLGVLDPSATDQIHTQVAIIDKPAADAFLRAAGTVAV